MLHAGHRRRSPWRRFPTQMRAGIRHPVGFRLRNADAGERVSYRDRCPPRSPGRPACPSRRIVAGRAASPTSARPGRAPPWSVQLRSTAPAGRPIYGTSRWWRRCQRSHRRGREGGVLAFIARHHPSRTSKARATRCVLLVSRPSSTPLGARRGAVPLAPKKAAEVRRLGARCVSAFAAGGSRSALTGAGRPRILEVRPRVSEALIVPRGARRAGDPLWVRRTANIFATGSASPRASTPALSAGGGDRGARLAHDSAARALVLFRASPGDSRAVSVLLASQASVMASDPRAACGSGSPGAPGDAPVGGGPGGPDGDERSATSERRLSPGRWARRFGPAACGKVRVEAAQSRRLLRRARARASLVAAAAAGFGVERGDGAPASACSGSLPSALVASWPRCR